MVAPQFTKYAALTTNWNYDTAITIAPNAESLCRWWNVQRVGDQQSRNAWRDAFGTFEWRRLNGERVAMLVFGTDTTDSLNAFNHALMARVQLALYTYLLNRPFIRSGGTIWVISGDADQNREPTSLRSWNRVTDLFIPYFVERPAFEQTPLDYQSSDWVRDWSADFAILDTLRNAQDWLVCPPFEMAVLSFLDASSSRHVDFRMPALVRTIESLIAIPRGQGAATFAQRAALFANAVQAHPALVAGLGACSFDQFLRDLFQLRSDAVHGKWPLRDLQQAGREDEVARLDFTAESIARTIIKWALRNNAVVSTYRTRQALETAWANGTIPPP